MPKRGTSPVTAAAGSPSITKLPLTEPKKKITRWLADGNESTVLAARADVQVRCYGRLIAPYRSVPPVGPNSREHFKTGAGFGRSHPDQLCGSPFASSVSVTSNADRETISR